MLDEEDFKNKYLQQPITFLTEENLDILETHCRRAVNFEKGFEHKVVLELLERYYQFQKEIELAKEQLKKQCEIADERNDLLVKVIELQKQNEELKQENKRIKYFSSNLFIGDYIPKKVIKDKLQENKAKTYCKHCDNTCDSYQLCKFLEELLGGE